MNLGGPELLVILVGLIVVGIIVFTVVMTLTRSKRPR
jgi:hypothetical protein